MTGAEIVEAIKIVCLYAVFAFAVWCFCKGNS
jgi:hypothetical protein